MSQVCESRAYTSDCQTLSSAIISFLNSFSNSLKDLAVFDCETTRATNTISCKMSIINRIVIRQSFFTI